MLVAAEFEDIVSIKRNAWCFDLVLGEKKWLLSYIKTLGWSRLVSCNVVREEDTLECGCAAVTRCGTCVVRGSPCVVHAVMDGRTWRSGSGVMRRLRTVERVWTRVTLCETSGDEPTDQGGLEFGYVVVPHRGTCVVHESPCVVHEMMDGWTRWSGVWVCGGAASWNVCST